MRPLIREGRSYANVASGPSEEGGARELVGRRSYVEYDNRDQGRGLWPCGKGGAMQIRVLSQGEVARIKCMVK